MSEFITEKSARLKKKWQEGRVTFGVVITLTDPACAEIMAQAGFDFAFIDMEHTTIDPHVLHGLLMGFHGTDTVPVVRVPSHDAAWIKRVLDLGAGGIIVPMVNTAEEAKAAVAACKYPPQGKRSIGPRRASNYAGDIQGLLPYWRAANRSLITIMLIEHHVGVANIDEILQVEGIDAIFIGPGDLSLSMGLLDQMQHPDVQAAVDRILSACRAAGIPTMMGAAPHREKIHQQASQGVQLLVLGSDVRFLAQAANRVLREAEEALTT